MFTSLVMNTAELHFNQAPDRPQSRRVLSAASCWSTAAWCSRSRSGSRREDTSENAIAEVEMDNGKHTNPVFHGDTIYAESTVLEKRDAHRPDAGW